MTRNNHCWERKADLSGNWGRGLCCNAFDKECNGLSYCSNSVSNEKLKLFTCPVDTIRCPSGGDAELYPTNWDQRITKERSW